MTNVIDTTNELNEASVTTVIDFKSPTTKETTMTNSPTNSKNLEEALGLQFHPLANIFPMIGKNEFAALVEDIKQNGQHETVKIYEGKILDGRNRYRACQQAKIEPKTEEYTGSDALGYVISLNMARRHMNESQRSMAAARIATLKRGDNQHTSIEASSQKEAAKMLNVSKSSLQRAVQVADKGIPELIEAVTDGRISIAAAVSTSALSDEKQLEIVTLDSKKAILEAIKQSGKHAPDCVCEQCTDKKQRTNSVTIMFTDEELQAIDKAIRRYGVSDSRETFIQCVMAEHCAERHLPPTKPEVNKLKKAVELADENYDPDMQDK